MHQFKKDKHDKGKYKKSVYAPFIRDIALYFETGERYLKKEETIKKWMNRDRAKNELLENATSPDDIYRNKCGNQ